MTPDFYGNKFKWFVGVVKARVNDTHVRVRIFGVHHIENTDNLSDGDLPEALVLYPVTESANATHTLQEEDWVYGFFADGDYCEQPIVVGRYHGGKWSGGKSGVGGDAGYGAGGGNEPGTSGPSGVPIGGATLSGKTTAEKLYNFFYEKLKNTPEVTGNIHVIASTMVGNFDAETIGFNIASFNPDEGAIGIAQWRYTSGRRQMLEKRSGVSTGQIPNLAQQADHVWWELYNQNEGTTARPRLFSAKTTADAAAAMTLYEGNCSRIVVNKRYVAVTAGPGAKCYNRILSRANEWVGLLSYTGDPPSTPSTATVQSARDISGQFTGAAPGGGL
jgi:hypothetical protein